MREKEHVCVICSCPPSEGDLYFQCLQMAILSGIQRVKDNSVGF